MLSRLQSAWQRDVHRKLRMSHPLTPPARPNAAERPDRQLAPALFASLLFIYLLTYSGAPHNPDEWFYLDGTQAALSGDFAGVQAHGRLFSWLIVPFYALSLAVPGVGSFQAGLLLNIAVTAATATLLFLVLAELQYASRLRLAAALTYGLGTLAWPYSHYLFREPAAGLALLAAVWAGLRFWRTGRLLPLLGGDRGVCVRGSDQTDVPGLPAHPGSRAVGVGLSVLAHPEPRAVDVYSASLVVPAADDRTRSTGPGSGRAAGRRPGLAGRSRARVRLDAAPPGYFCRALGQPRLGIAFLLPNPSDRGDRCVRIGAPAPGRRLVELGRLAVLCAALDDEPHLVGLLGIRPAPTGPASAAALPDSAGGISVAGPATWVSGQNAGPGSRGNRLRDSASRRCDALQRVYARGVVRRQYRRRGRHLELGALAHSRDAALPASPGVGFRLDHGPRQGRSR